MRRVLKWLGVLIGAIVGLVVVALVAAYFISSGKLNNTYALEPATVTLPTDEASLVRGQRMAPADGVGAHRQDERRGAARHLPLP